MLFGIVIEFRLVQPEKAYENIYSENEIKIINSDKEYKIRFKIIEYIELFKNKVDIDFKR